jgi:hypothetical protein
MPWWMGWTCAVVADSVDVAPDGLPVVGALMAIRDLLGGKVTAGALAGQRRRLCSGGHPAGGLGPLPRMGADARSTVRDSRASLFDFCAEFHYTMIQLGRVEVRTTRDSC